MGRLITLLITLLIPPISLAGFLPNRYTRTGEELLGKNLLSAHAVAHLMRGIRCRKSPPIRWPGRPRQRPTNSTRPVTEGCSRIVPDSPAWFAWLDQVSSFAFSGKVGHYTARKEAKQRGDRYWYAYLAMGEQLSKKYLGKTADLTLARLEHIAGLLSTAQAASVQRGQKTPSPPTQSEAQVSAPVSLVATDANAEENTAQRSLLARRSDPLHPLLATKLHMPRPRTHLVPRAHLTERLQQGAERALTLDLGPCRVWQNDVACPMARRERYACRLALVGSGGQRPDALSLLPDCRLANP